jgi:hypothetical protein
MQKLNVSTLTVEVTQTARRKVRGTALGSFSVAYSAQTTDPQKAAELATAAGSMAAGPTSFASSLTTAFADAGVAFDASSVDVSPPSTSHVVTAAAVGDPHMANMRGERFDIMQAGAHVLVRIPRGAVAETSLLAAEAYAERSGLACTELYFKALNLTGKWADELNRGGFQFFANAPNTHSRAGWLHIKHVDVKVRWGRTGEGVEYLNLFFRHLGRAGFPVGGLLGEDDHSHAATPTPHCARTMSLLAFL